jgi:hypothetical protein
MPNLTRFLAVCALVALAAPVSAQTTLFVNSKSPYADSNGPLYVNGGPGPLYGFVNTTNKLYTAFGSSNVTQQLNTALGPGIQAYDRLWIDFRADNSALSTSEALELATFIASGKRTVIIGENNGFTTWNNSFLALLGGTSNPQCFYSNTATVLTHALTAGVSSTTPACASLAVGGTSLFADNYATLWGAQQNVLTVLDADVFDDNFGQAANNPQFATNVATWLAQPTVVATPEPASLLLMATGLMAVAAVRARRKFVA